jgi:hypothetical protein
MRWPGLSSRDGEAAGRARPSSVASQGVRPRPTASATVSNSVKQCKIATVGEGFFPPRPGPRPLWPGA